MTKNSLNVKKLAVASLLCAVAVVGSTFSFMVLGSKCAPVQHMVNILCAVLLGPGYGIGVAFAASLLRNLLALGTLMAFPGSMLGALLCGLVYHFSRNIPATLVGEVFGTAVLGGMCAWPIAVFVMGQEAAVFAFVVPFLISTAAGALISAALIYSLKRMGLLRTMQEHLAQ